MTLNGTTQVITGAGGEPLTPEEEQSLRTIFEYYEQAEIAFADLLAPIN
jgi:hypothetical protein